MPCERRQERVPSCLGSPINYLLVVEKYDYWFLDVFLGLSSWFVVLAQGIIGGAVCCTGSCSFIAIRVVSSFPTTRVLLFYLRLIRSRCLRPLRVDRDEPRRSTYYHKRCNRLLAIWRRLCASDNHVFLSNASLLPCTPRTHALSSSLCCPPTTRHLDNSPAIIYSRA